jgi:hypothetical protein
MSGQPLQLARESCAGVVRILRPHDFFSLVVFDDFAQVVIPLQKPTDRQGMTTAIAVISGGGSTNLMAGWLLGRDELLKVGAEGDKKILVLTDGHLNQGTIEPDTVSPIFSSWPGPAGIRYGKPSRHGFPAALCRCYAMLATVTTALPAATDLLLAAGDRRDCFDTL